MCWRPSFSKESKSLKTSSLEELETSLSAWFKQACTTNASTDGPQLKEKAKHVATHLGIDGFRASDGWIYSFKKIHNLVYKTMLGESAIVNPKTVTDWKSKELSKIINGYQRKDMFNVDETGLFYNLQPSKTLTYEGDPCHGGTKSKHRVTVLLGCNADGTETLPPLAIRKYNKPNCFRNVKKLPTQFTANSSSWMTSVTSEEFLVQMDHQIWAKNTKKSCSSLTNVVHAQEIPLL